jgi:Holliday junction resolvasome RuvABC endonuclease subunit
LFLEPEGVDSNEYYINGFSSSLPIDVQIAAIQTVPGLENAQLFRPGYAIEYDFFDPTQLKHTLETKLIKYGSFTVKSASQDERRTEIKQWLASMINNWKPDLVALEDIQLQQFGAKDGDNIEGVTTFKTLAHLQGVLMNYLFENKIPYEIIHVSVWRKHCDIKGKSRSDKKKSAQLKVKEWYDVSVTTDEADAICIGKYAAETTIQKITMLSW